MADNAAQSIKDLQKNIDDLDKKVETAVNALAEYEGHIGSVFAKIRDKGIASTDQVVDYFVKKLKTLSVKGLAAPLEDLFGLNDQKAADEAVKYTEEKNKKQLEIERAYNEREMQLAEEREKQKLQAEQAYAKERENLLKLEAKKQEDIAKAWAQHDKQQAASSTDLNALGNFAATKGLTGNLAALKDNSVFKRYAEERKKIARETAAEEAKASKAIQQQIQYYRQLHTLYKGYKDLQAKPNKTKEDIAILEQTKQKILEILRLSKQLELENKGSRQAGINATGFQRLADNLRNASKETKTLKANLNNLLPTLQRLASAFGIAFSVRGLAQFGKKLIETRGEFERQQVALRSILQNKQLADEIWDKTMQAALQSPFTAMQLTTYTKQLAAYRIETDKLFDTTKRLADISAGLGVDMQRLILAYGQVKAANYLRASEIRQFTEAGVNVLGELSQYFTETREGMYDTAKVMDMVTKRLVTFEDVEAIFKRMTDAGGIFYNMQYVQSQTVKGQIAKLHDAYDQMLNSIGQANEGTLKELVSILNSIVKNWRSWAVVLKSIAWGAAIGYMSKFTLPLMGIGKASVSTLRSIVKLKQGIQSLGTTLKANLPMLGIFAATAAITALNNLRKKMNEVNKEIDEQNLRLYESRQNFEGMKSKIEENNKTLKNASSKTDDLNKAQKENESIMQKLRNEYPQLADQMQIATNGIIEMNGALDVNIRKLNEQMTILNAMKQGNWFSDSDQKNLTDWQGALATMKTTLIAAQSEARKKVMQMELGGETDEPLYDIYKRVADIDLSGNILDAVSAFNLLNGEVLAYQSNLYKGTPTRSESLYSMLGIKGGDLQANWSKNRVTEVLNRLSPTLQTYYENGIRDNADFLKEINEQYGGNVTQFIQANAEKINQATLDGLNNANSILINTLKPQTEEMKNFLNQELNKLFGTNGIDYFSKSTQDTKSTGSETPTTGKSTKESASRLISLIKEMRGEYDKLSKSAYGYAKSQDKVRQSYEDSVREILGEAGVGIDYDFTTNEGMIAALEKVKSFVQGSSKYAKDAWKDVQKYIDQLETEIEINAQVRIREDFGKRMEQALNNYELTIELDKLNLPTGVAADMWGIEETDLQDLRKRLSQMYMGLRDENGQLSDEAFKDYEKFLNKIDDLERKQQKERLKDYSKYLEAQYSERVKIEMDYVRKLAALEAETSIKEPQKREIREGLKREFLEKSRKQDWEDFKGSEFYVGMMEDLEKQGSASLEVMRKKLLEMRENAENLSPRALKEVVNALEKIDELEKKRIPPLKRIREEQEKLKDINIKETYRELALNQEKLAQAEQEQRELERMIMLEEERQKLEKQGITLEEAKARLAKSEQALSLILPSLDMRSDGSKDAEERRRIMSETVNQAKTEVEKWQEIVRILSGQFIIEGQEQGSKYRGLSLSDMKSRRDDAKKRIKDLEGVIGKDEELVKAQKDLADAWNDTWEVVKKWAQSVNGIFDGVMESVEYFTDETYGMVDAWKEFGDTSVSALTDLVSGIQAYQQANEEARKAGFATGLLTANGLQLAMVVLSVIIKVVQALSKLHDSRLDKEIQIQQERIDNLQRAYERLEKQIEKTWSTVSYIRTYREETQNLYEQYEALTNQINAEEAKKNTDKDKLQDYQDKQQEILDTLEEIKQQQIEVFGGIGEDSYRGAAEGFVDAWKSAFLETGDGLQGLQDHFDEFLNDWFVKQATMRIAASNLEPLFRKIDDAVDQYGVGGANVTWQELKEINDLKDVLLAQTNEQLQQLAGVFGLGGEGSLSGLAAGIQGMTEEQANILEAYWNSVRMYSANIDMNVTRIAQILGAGGDNSNPMLRQMELVRENTDNIRSLLNSVSFNGGEGVGIRVYSF